MTCVLSLIRPIDAVENNAYWESKSAHAGKLQKNQHHGCSCYYCADDTQLYLTLKTQDHVGISELLGPSVYSLPCKDQQPDSEGKGNRTVLASRRNAFGDFSKAWPLLEVHTHHGQLNLLLRHALPFLSATKLTASIPNWLQLPGRPHSILVSSSRPLLHTTFSWSLGCNTKQSSQVWA